ncbi:hypothetical protein F0L17_04525 [Streptomyces sp. TRM43335]|uniref:ORC1/DEAH AAA+ ATPase domain-containing protein n=1 Tax=Streptomyces taklimakanensis TaxID=2569853 RepID=A0A6G2B8F3_9ACTN|nr:hypothetical protein [Streptomyces taklimakanensis]
MHTGGSAPAADAVPGTAATDGPTGRRRELERLRAEVGRAGPDVRSGRPAPRCPVLSITGRPGSGRTAVAEELVRQVAADYPDGVLRARLTEPDGTPVPVEHTVRDLLGALTGPVPAVPAGAGEEELTGALRAALAGRRALLLLDEPADPGRLSSLLPDNRECLALVVSRTPPTGVPDVRPCALGGLDTASAVALLDRWAGDTPRVTVDPRAAESLAEACGGRPAALVLVGGWLAAHPAASVAEAARRFEAQPDRLPGAVEEDDAADAEPVGDADDAAGRFPGAAPGSVSGSSGGSAGSVPSAVRTGVPRPRARRTAVARPLVRAFRLVHDSLPATAARALRLLALAPAGLVDAHTAAALCGCPPESAGATLEGFARLGLLRTTVTPGLYSVPRCLAPMLAAAAADGERPADLRLARARMLERLVRLLGSCRAVAEPPGSPARRRAEELPRALRFATASAAATWLDTRLPALRAAVRTAARDGELDTLTRRLAAALARALTVHRGPEAAAPELYRLYELLLPVTERRGLHTERAAALLDLGDLDADASRPHRALARYRAALEAARADGARADGGRGGRRGEWAEATAARALESLGETYAHLGDRQRSIDWYGRALALCQTRGDLAGEARLHGRIGAEHLRAGDWEAALRARRAAAAACRRLRDGEAYARALEEVAAVQEYAGRVEDALRTRREARRWAGRGAGGPVGSRTGPVRRMLEEGPDPAG